MELPQWRPDASVTVCETCRLPFTLLNRRHHCRACGNIFCDDHSKQKVAMPCDKIVRRPGQARPFGMFKTVRVCNNCAKEYMNNGMGNLLAMAGAFGNTGNTGNMGNMGHMGNVGAVPQYNQPQAASAPPARVAGEVADIGPDPPETAFTRPVPKFAEKPKMGLGTGLNIASALLAHSDDPQLSAEDNAIAKANLIHNVSGVTGVQQQLAQAFAELEKYHLPPGIKGFLVIEPPNNGTIAQEMGIRPYDLIIEAEGKVLTNEQGLVSLQVFNDIKKDAWEKKGVCEIKVYNFTTHKYRRLPFRMPPGKPNAILGASIRPLPDSPECTPQSAAAMGDKSEFYVQGWRKNGNMYISATPNAYPLYGTRTSENADIYVKVWKKVNGMMVSTGEYHPLYNYTKPSGELYVEVWRNVNGMMIHSSGNYQPLPNRD